MVRIHTALAWLGIVAGIGILSAASYYTYLRITAGDDRESFVSQVPDKDVVLGVLAPKGESDSLPSPSLAIFYPAQSVNPKYWASHDTIKDGPFGAPGLPEGFKPIEAKDLQDILDIASEQVVLRMRIPVIHLDTPVSDLELLDLGDSAQYETPDNVVGFIPETDRPGEGGTGWYFGHLESFGHNEGSVFRGIPNIVDMIKNDPVDVFLSTEDAEYIYRVTQTNQVSAEDLALFESGPETITLCTCWPPKVYTERVLITAQLIAIKLAA